MGDNVWTIAGRRRLTAPPVTGLEIAVVPWMPLHDHGLVPATYGATDRGDGSYDLEVFDLIMPGLWQFTIDTAAGSETEDATTFLFCAEG